MIIPADRQSEEDEVLARISRGEAVTHFETVRQHKDGHLIDISLTVSPIRNRAGEIIGASKIARDITEQKRLVRQLEEAGRLKDEFLATLSHELRTPLNAILAYGHILRGLRITDEQRQRAIDTIDRNARALNRLVSEVLDVSRIVTGKIRLNMQRCDLAIVLDAALEAVRPAIDAKGLRLERRVEPDLPLVHCDPDRMQQVFWNLLTNAVKFTGTGGCIEVRTTQNTSHVQIAIRDTAIGVDPEFAPHMFERFRQADSRPTREFGGLGLGLSLARDFVEMHGGTLDASSPGIGEGATFVVKLPVHRL